MMVIMLLLFGVKDFSCWETKEYKLEGRPYKVDLVLLNSLATIAARNQ